MNKRYAGTRTADGVIVVVTLSDRRQWTRMRPLRHIPMHSPAGFDWGYHGSGPADLALAILVDHFHERPPRSGWLAGVALSRWATDSHAFRHHQAFKREFVAQFAECWELAAEDIAAWLTKRTTDTPHSE